MRRDSHDRTDRDTEQPKNKISRSRTALCLLPHLLAEVTASPGLTGPAMNPVHVCGIGLTLQVAVHGLEDVVEMDHLDVVIPAIASDHRVVRPGSEVIRTVRREGDRPVVEAVKVDDVYWRVRHGVVTSQWRAAHRSHRGQRGRESLHDSGPDKHSSIAGSGHVKVVGINTPGVHDVVENGLSEDDIVMAGGPVTGSLKGRAVSIFDTGCVAFINIE